MRRKLEEALGSPETAAIVEPLSDDADLRSAGIGAGDDDVSGIQLSHHLKDVFHIEQALANAFGTRNSWAPMFLEAVESRSPEPQPGSDDAARIRPSVCPGVGQAWRSREHTEGGIIGWFMRIFG